MLDHGPDYLINRYEQNCTKVISGKTGIGVNYQNQQDKLMETKEGEDRKPNKKDMHKHKKVNVNKCIWNGLRQR